MGPFLHYLTLSDPSELARPRHLAWLDWGDPLNPYVVVCVHGLSRNARDFDLLARHLSAHFRVICPDMAGRGKSGWLVNKSDYTYALYASDALALLDHLHIDRASWIGTSMGGIVGMMLAAAQKQRIPALVLNDIGARISAQGLRRILGYVGVGGTFNDGPSAMAYLQSVLAPFHITSEEHWRYMFDASFVALPDGRYALAYDPGINQPFRDAVSKEEGIVDVDLSLFWNQVACPTLILRGEHSDILTKSTAEAMRAVSQPVTLVEIKDTGHAPPLLEESQIQVIADWMLDIHPQLRH